jgi:hypothetical protein
VIDNRNLNRGHGILSGLTSIDNSPKFGSRKFPRSFEI